MKNIIKVLSVLSFCSIVSFASMDIIQAEVEKIQESKNMTLPNKNINLFDKVKQKERVTTNQKVFGENLFNGKFSTNRQYRYNPNYLLNIGDEVRLKMWGAYDFEGLFTVDTQGNIFVPKVGVIKLLGVKNNKISKLIEKKVKNIFKNNVYIYADLKEYQHISVFVTGSVRSPGLYEGLSSDSIVQFLDKANGIDNIYGSYRKIKILRSNKLIKTIDLYDFLLRGQLDIFQFKMGDVVLVENIDSYIQVEGDAKRPFRFELKSNIVTMKEIVKQAVPHPSVTNFVIVNLNSENQRSSKLYNIKEESNLLIKSGETVRFLSDHITKSFEVFIDGEHAGLHSRVVNKGMTLEHFLKTISFSKFSDKNSIQLYRKSVAETQKQLIDSSLRDLESNILTAGSATTEEAVIRKQEASLVLNFIERARKVEPKGRVVINKKTDLNKIYLEEDDIIYIPKKSHMITIQGEVKLPGAHTFVDDLDIEDYIKSCGGYSFRADEDNVLLIKPSGFTFTYDDSSFSSQVLNVTPGDSILVLGKVDSKSLQVTKDITQILYQIAVGAGVVINAF